MVNILILVWWYHGGDYHDDDDEDDDHDHENDDNHNQTQSILNELQFLYHASMLLTKKLATVQGLKAGPLSIHSWINNFTKWISCKEVILMSEINTGFSMFNDIPVE